MRRLLLAVLLALLAVPAPARGAEQLLDTITVPADSSTVVTGKYDLEAGTRYVIEVTGTMESVNKQGGYGAKYDALYCVNTINTESDHCSPARAQAGNRQYRSSDFKLSSGSLTDDWRLADQFLSTNKPFGDQPAVDYDPNHSYTLGFHPPADGPIKAQTYYAATGGCPNCTNSTTGTFTVKVYGEPPASTTPPPPPPPPACASAAATLQAAPCGGTCLTCRKFGETTVVKAPEPNTAIDVGGVTIDPAAREILFEAGITDAAAQQLIATLILRHKAARLRDQFWGCVHIGSLAPDPYQAPYDYSPKNPQKLPALIRACTEIIVTEAQQQAKVGRPIAVASQANPGCRLVFFPAYSAKDRRSPRRRERIQKAVTRTLDGGCTASASQLSFRLKSKRKGVPMYKLTNRTLSARLVRVAARGTPTPASAKLYMRWRKP